MLFRWLRSARIVRVSPLLTEADEEEEGEGEESFMFPSMLEEEEREEWWEEWEAWEEEEDPCK